MFHTPINRTKYWVGTVAVLAALTVPSIAQAQQKGIVSFLQKEPMTQFDAGMKSLRRQALDAAARLTNSTQAKVTSSIGFKADRSIIEIVFVFNQPPGGASPTREKCVELRRKAITDMLRIGRSEYGSELSVPERIRRRIGGQFAHEPTTTMSEVISIGEWLSAMTYFEVLLRIEGDTTSTLSCRDLVTESLSR